MKLNKCFTSVFDDALKAQGFKRKGMVYYRLHGEILQGITMKAMNPFMICYTFFPWWLHRKVNKCGTSDFKKNDWADRQMFFYTMHYHKEENYEETVEIMKEALNCVRNDLIPSLDGISTVDDYISALLFSERNGKRLFSPSELPDEVLYYKAWKDQSAEKAHSLYRKNRMDEAERKIKSYDPEAIAEGKRMEYEALLELANEGDEQDKADFQRLVARGVFEVPPMPEEYKPENVMKSAEQDCEEFLRRCADNYNGIADYYAQESECVGEMIRTILKLEV